MSDRPVPETGEREAEALAWTLERVHQAYPDYDLSEAFTADVARLVDSVADARRQGDRLSALVYGMRLLSETELVELWERLG